jgi:glycoside/pentoside/hexuronide:cation symporter, GPH family
MLPLRHKIGYSLGDLGISISYFTVGFFFIYYLTDIVGLAPYLAGLAYFIGKAWDSVNDPLIGAMNDRSSSSLGRKRSYLIFGVVPFAISFIILWTAPLEASQAIKFLYATVAMLLYATLYSLIAVPYMALVPVMTTDYDERTQIIGIRAVLSTVGTLIGGGAALIVSRFTSELMGLRIMAASFSILLIVTIYLAAQSVRNVESDPPNKPSTKLLDWRLYWRLLRERNIGVLMIFKFIAAIATGSLTASLPFFAKHILGDEGRSTIGLAIYIVISAAFIPVWNFLAHRFERRHLLLIAMIILAAILFVVGLFVSSESLLAFYIGCGLMGTVMSAFMLLAFAFPPDLVDYYEHLSGERHESIIFGLWMTVHQFGIGAAGLLLGFFLQIFRYDGSLAVQPDSALLAVRMSLGVLPGIAMILAVIVLQKYDITRQKYQEIRLALGKVRLA